MAEKAKASPRRPPPCSSAARCRSWYKDNGWTYPVQGPRRVRPRRGAAVLRGARPDAGAEGGDQRQQSIALTGSPGEQLRHVIEVKTEEKRPVYAHGTSDQPWLEVGKAKLNGRVATIPLSIPSVPNKPGETLKAKLTVLSNGNQKFVVPVTLQVGGTFVSPPPTIPAPPIPAPVGPSVVAALPVEARRPPPFDNDLSRSRTRRRPAPSRGRSAPRQPQCAPAIRRRGSCT